MTTVSKGKEHQLEFTSNKKCEKCGRKFTVAGKIKSVTRRKTCGHCKKQNIKKNNDKSNYKIKQKKVKK